MNRNKTTIYILFLSLLFSTRLLSTELTPEQELDAMIENMEQEVEAAVESYLESLKKQND